MKLLGVQIDNHMNFHYHVDQLCRKAARQLNALARIHRLLDSESKLAIVRSFIASNFNYCPLVWHFCGSKLTKKMEGILKRALRFAYCDYSSDYESLLKKANLVSLELNRQRTIAIETYKALHGLSPSFLVDLFKVYSSVYNTRQNNQLCVPSVKSTHFGIHSLKFLAAKIWNSLPSEATNQVTLKGFKTCISNWYGFTCKCQACA